MRKLLIAMAIISVAACTQMPTAPSPAAAEAGSTSIGGGVGPSVTGSAHRLAGDLQRTATFSAITMPDGTIQGEAQLNVRASDVWWHTRIECLTVDGNRAYLGGTITAASDARVRIGTKSYFWVEDNGEGPGAPPDRVSISNPNETQQGLDDFCNLVQNLLPGSDVLRGNVQIR